MKTLRDFMSALDRQWHAKTIKIDWLSYEGFVVDVLKSDLSQEEKIALVKEALDAWTRRGHFNPREFLENY